MKTTMRLSLILLLGGIGLLAGYGLEGRAQGGAAPPPPPAPRPATVIDPATGLPLPAHHALPSEAVLTPSAALRPNSGEPYALPELVVGRKIKEI